MEYPMDSQTAARYFVSAIVFATITAIVSAFVGLIAVTGCYFGRGCESVTYWIAPVLGVSAYLTKMHLGNVANNRKDSSP